MRVISQDGNTDLPYENIILYIEERTTGGGRYVYDVYATVDWNKCRLLATYRTESKAKKAFEMLHNAYVGIIKGLNVEISEGMEKKINEIMKNGYGMLIAKENYEGNRLEFYPMNTIFQFPADEDLEE